MDALTTQARCYAGQAADAWKADHADAMNCRRLEELIALGDALWGVCKRIVSRRSPDAPEDEERQFATEMLDVYRLLASACDALAAGVERVTARGYAVDGADTLASMRVDLERALAVPVERVFRAVRHIKEGKTHPLAEVRRELQRRLHG